MNYDEISCFKNDLKTKIKKYKSLKEDLNLFKKILKAYPKGIRGKKSTVLRRNNSYKIIKHRFNSQSLKKMILRIIYIYFFKEQKIVFIELYSKSDQKNHNEKRIKDYLQSLD